MVALLRHTVRRPRGYLLVTDEEGRTLDEGDTLMCVHCQYHWQVQPGSGAERGWCFRCGGPTCGKPRCDVCVPFERALEEAEARSRLWDTVHSSFFRRQE